MCNLFSKERLQIDHWLPLSLGNPLTRKNAVLLCKSCNSSKKDKLPTLKFNENIVRKIESLLFS